MPATMRAARMHAVGAPMAIDTIAVPKPGSTDVLVEVKACGMVPNLGNVLANWTKWFPHLPLPKLPAIFGLDPAGVVAARRESLVNLLTELVAHRSYAGSPVASWCDNFYHSASVFPFNSNFSN